jgi:hypothetical protein
VPLWQWLPKKIVHLVLPEKWLRNVRAKLRPPPAPPAIPAPLPGPRRAA